MRQTAFVFFDEYGDGGLTPSASEWLILSAAIQRAEAIDSVRACYDGFKSLYKRPANWHFHFKKQDHRARLAFIRQMSPAGYAFASTAVHKGSLVKPGNFRRRYYLYHYAIRLTLERVSHYAKREGLQIGAIFLSQRGGLCLDELEEYLRKLQARGSTGSYIYWPALRGCQMRLEKNEKRIGLQMADLMASSLGHAVSFDDYGVTEPRYLLTLKNALCQSDGQIIGRGLKFFPPLSLVQKKEERFQWLPKLAANEAREDVAA